jgi:hypothetical protein
MTTTPGITPNFRRLCKELVDAFDIPLSLEYKALALVRARAALATPPPEPPPVKLKRSGGYQPLAHSSKTISPPQNP